MGPMSKAVAESAAAAQRLRREAERGIRFRRSAGKLVQASRVAKGMNIGKSIKEWPQHQDHNSKCVNNTIKR